MIIWKFGQCLVLLAALGAGCGSADKPVADKTPPPAGSGPATPPPKVDAPRYATEPQSKLRTIKLWIGAEEMITEIAMSQKEIETGMMHRVSIAENEGMLFVFPYPHQTAFWMKNTLVPLSCAYIDPDGVVLETHDMFPNDETPIKAKSDRVQFVLETKQGWFERHKVGPGAVMRTERGTLAQTFLRPPQ